MQTTAWPPMTCEWVVKTVNEFDLAVRELRRVGHCVHLQPSRDGLRCGQDVWSTADRQPIRIAWAWTEIQPDVVALFDPMNIQCNVALIDGEGHALAGSRRMLHLNNVVHRLDWRFAR